jgi:hypothetical protein
VCGGALCVHTMNCSSPSLSPGLPGLSLAKQTPTEERSQWGVKTAACPVVRTGRRRRRSGGHRKNLPSLVSVDSWSPATVLVPAGEDVTNSQHEV